jgi:3',5'-cyclic AMP phosphodiesterase CpdA
VHPAFVLISGDLVRDALRVSEAEARGYYDLLMKELSEYRMPVYTVPGNHENFGIERHLSLVSRQHPLYGKRMYRSYLGPNYYGVTWGGVHFIGLDTVDYDDLWYNGHVDSLQLAWLAADVAALPAGTPVVTFNHIPLVTAAEMIDGYRDDGLAPTTIRIGGKVHFRHVVRNTADVLKTLGDRLELALGGHVHRREMLTYETAFGTRRFYQTAAVTDPDQGEGPLGIRSGVTLYRVSEGKVDEGTFIPLNLPDRGTNP